jgi:ubiquinone biosynthesis protein
MNEKRIPSYLRPRNIKRYRHIVLVLARHGFGSVLDYFDVSQRLSLPRRLLRQEPVERISPAVHFRLALEELGPTFIKIGQILSTRPDLLPPEYITELTKLQDNAPPVTWEEMHAVLVKELGENPEQFFSSIDREPIAAASLAQVHSASLHDGCKVVIKIQRPRIQEHIDTDMEILHDMAVLAERTPVGKIYNPIEMIDDFAYTLDNELDYRREGRNADTFRKNFSRENHIYVPEIYWDLSTRHVLVMERIEGIKVDEIEALDAAGYDRKKLANDFMRMIIKEILEDGFFHGDPHPGNLIVMPDGVLGAMDFGLVGQLRPTERQNLIRLFLAAVALDADAIAELILRIGVTNDDFPLDKKALTRDIDRILMKYQGLPLEDLQAQDIINEINPIALEYHLQMPSDFWLLGKTITIMEGIGLTLDPELNLMKVGKQYSQKLAWQLLLPQKNLGQILVQQSADWGDLIRALPRTSNRLLEKAESGDLFQVGFKDTNRIINGLNRLTTRLALSLLASALLISLAMLIPITATGSIVQWLVSIGFFGAAGLGVWLLISMQKSI